MWMILIFEIGMNILYFDYLFSEASEGYKPNFKDNINTFLYIGCRYNR